MDRVLDSLESRKVLFTDINTSQVFRVWGDEYL